MSMTLGPNVKVTLHESQGTNYESENALQVPKGPITRARARKLKEALSVLIQTIRVEMEQSTFHSGLNMEQQPYNVLFVFISNSNFK